MQKCLLNARVFHDAMDRPLETMPRNLEFHLFVGEAHRTPSQFAGGRNDRCVRWTCYAPGDGTVLASSVRMDEPEGRSPIPWHSITMLKSSHMGLLKDSALLVRVLDLLRGAGIGKSQC
jgi:hypothetical protein